MNYKKFFFVILFPELYVFGIALLMLSNTIVQSLAQLSTATVSYFIFTLWQFFFYLAHLSFTHKKSEINVTTRAEKALVIFTGIFFLCITVFFSLFLVIFSITEKVEAFSGIFLVILFGVVAAHIYSSYRSSHIDVQTLTKKQYQEKFNGYASGLFLQTLLYPSFGIFLVIGLMNTPLLPLAFIFLFFILLINRIFSIYFKRNAVGIVLILLMVIVGFSFLLFQLFVSRAVT